MAVDVAEHHLSVIQSPPDWEVGVYAAGALALLGITALSLWKLWTSGSFPSPSPFPNYNYRYLQQKYGETSAEARQKSACLGCPAGQPSGTTQSQRQPQHGGHLREHQRAGATGADGPGAGPGPLRDPPQVPVRGLRQLRLLCEQHLRAGLHAGPGGGGHGLRRHLARPPRGRAAGEGPPGAGGDQLRVLLHAHQPAARGADRGHLPDPEERLLHRLLRREVLRPPGPRGPGGEELAVLGVRHRRGRAECQHRRRGAEAVSAGPPAAALQRLALPAGPEQGRRRRGRDPAVPQLPAHGRAPHRGGGEGQEPHLDQRQGHGGPLRQGVPAAGREEDEQKEDRREEGRPQPRVQRSHDLLGAGHRAPGPVPPRDRGREYQRRPRGQYRPRHHRALGERHGHHPLEPDAGHTAQARVHVAPRPAKLAAGARPAVTPSAIAQREP